MDTGKPIQLPGKKLPGKLPDRPKKRFGTARNILALMLREMSTRYGRKALREGRRANYLTFRKG